MKKAKTKAFAANLMSGASGMAVNGGAVPASCSYKTEFREGDRLLSLPEVQKIIPVSKTRWYELMATGEAPKPIKISRQRVAWIESEIFALLNKRIAERNARNNQNQQD